VRNINVGKLAKIINKCETFLTSLMVYKKINITKTASEDNDGVH